MASLARMPGGRQNTHICRHQQTSAKGQPVTQNGGSCVGIAAVLGTLRDHWGGLILGKTLLAAAATCHAALSQLVPGATR